MKALSDPPMIKPSRFSNSLAVVIAAVGVVAPLSASAARNVASLARGFAEQDLNARATVSPHGVLVEWTASFENRILGFDVFRVIRIQRVKLNPGLIAGPTMIFAARSQTFAWFDPEGIVDSQYEVQSVDLRGEPLLGVMAAPTIAATLPAYRQSPLLADRAVDKSIQISEVEWTDSAEVNRSS